MQRVKNIITMILVGTFIITMLTIQIFTEDKRFSNTERRPLQLLPQVGIENIKSGNFMNAFDSYTQDQFPFRNGFRGIKVAVALNIFKQKEVNDLYIKDKHIIKMEYPESEAMLEYAAERFEYLYNNYLKDTQVQIFASIVPDKNYFLADQSGHLSMNYDKFINKFKTMNSYMKYIDITELLSIQDYYYTDTHWRQEKLISVAEKLGQAMNTPVLGQEAYEVMTYDKPFYGVYAGQIGIPVSFDTINYLTNEILEQCVVTSYDTGKPVIKPMYDLNKANGKDAYDLFLSGAQALLIIENPNATTEKELVIFRDSFGSSLAPLLVSSYQKITLVDIRYIKGSMIGEFLNFKNQDVLFLYSTLVLNNSLGLK